MFDIKAFMFDERTGAPFVLPIIMALVTYWGRLGVKGNWQLLSSLATGLVVGGVTL